VSTGEQTLDLPLDVLKAAGYSKVYPETARRRPTGPSSMRSFPSLRKGDTLVVWRLDRLGRSLGHLTEVVAALAERGVGFKSLTEQIDTTAPGSELIFCVFGALADFERDPIRERTQAGLLAARARGRGPSLPAGRPISPRSVKPLAFPGQASIAP
jgi:DNA invertase Pin-like site-specific DNA recombinase